MLSDRRYPSFRNFDSTISIDVIRMKSYMDSLFDPTSKRLTNFFPDRKMPRFVSVLRNCGGFRARKPYISAEFWLQNAMLVIWFQLLQDHLHNTGVAPFSESLTLPKSLLKNRKISDSFTETYKKMINSMFAVRNLLNSRCSILFDL